MLDRLESGARRQRTFVADASHDLQSPLTAMRADLEVALAHPDRVKVSELAHDLLAASSHMEDVVSDLLHLAVEDDAPHPDPALLDLDTIVLEEVARARPGSTVALAVQAVSAAPVLGDAAALRRLVRNLLDNAVRHADAQVEVALATSADGAVVLDVRDDGPGVPPEHRDRVFDRFFRGDVARTPRTGGSGLGLAIARRVAERHHGTLTREAGAGLGGRGAHFRLELPGA